MVNSEIDCITSCLITPPNPYQFYINLVLIAVMIITVFILVFFKKKLTLKQNLWSKSLLLLAIFLLLVSLALARPSFITFFATVHNFILLLILATFLALYFLAVPVSLIGLPIQSPDSKTKLLFEQFTCSFNEVNLAIVMDIYASNRENYDPSVSGEMLSRSIDKISHNSIFLPKPSDVVKYIQQNAFNEKSVVIVMGAGDVYKIAYELVR